MDSTAIIASVLGGLVSGLFTFLGVFLTIRYQYKKDKKEEARLIQEKAQVLESNRPRLEITSCSELVPFDRDFQADLSVLVVTIKKYEPHVHHFMYDPAMQDKKNLVCANYKLKNTGNTEIDHLYLMTNLPRNTSLFNIGNNEYLFCYEHKMLNYSAILDKSIKPGEEINLSVAFINNKIVYSNMGNALLSVWLFDINGNVWRQAFFAPDNKIYNSKRTSLREFRAEDDIVTALKCFDNPMLW